jgi:hypothetical protein
MGKVILSQNKHWKSYKNLYSREIVELLINNWFSLLCDTSICQSTFPTRTLGTRETIITYNQEETSEAINVIPFWKYFYK